MRTITKILYAIFFSTVNYCIYIFLLWKQSDNFNLIQMVIFTVPLLLTLYYLANRLLISNFNNTSIQSVKGKRRFLITLISLMIYVALPLNFRHHSNLDELSIFFNAIVAFALVVCIYLFPFRIFRN